MSPARKRFAVAAGAAAERGGSGRRHDAWTSRRRDVSAAERPAAAAVPRSRGG